MNGTQVHVTTHESLSDARTGFLAGSALEGFGAVATIALAIVGLAGVLSSTMAAIATIIVGAATVLEGAAFGFGTARINATPAAAAESRWFEHGLAADFQGGLGTLVLGILALLGIQSQTLLSVAVIALGTTFLFSGRLLIGLASIVLGILAVVGFTPMTLVLVGLLTLGAGLLFSGSRHAMSTASART